jgi:hypothetical protein
VELETRGQGTRVDPYDLDKIYGTGSPLALRYPLFPWPTLSQFQARCYAFVSFVRNPYTRLLSCYTNKIVPRGEALKHLLGGAAPVDFPAFARTVVAQRDRDMDTHWRPQTVNLFHGQIDYAFLGRFENFAADFARVFDVLQIPVANRPASRHLNSSSRAGRSLAEFYSPEIQDLVYQRYRADFEAYGYPYELP